VDTEQFWQLIEDARGQVTEPTDGDAVADRASTLLAALSPGEIIAAEQILWDLMGSSYRDSLWAAAYLINGGCSDDGFDYFRGWLITQGREAFDRAVAEPDALAELPAVLAASVEGMEMECETTLTIAWNAHRAATGEQLPAGARAVHYPEQGSGWDFDFDDQDEMRRRLPRLAALYLG
jgi:hypothetical protein